MNKLSLLALALAVLTTSATIVEARMARIVEPVTPYGTVVIDADPLTREGEQDIEYYIGQEGVLNGGRFMAGCGTPCQTTCPCPMECPCVPTCCPAVRGIFDGGMCCGGRVIPCTPSPCCA